MPELTVYYVASPFRLATVSFLCNTFSVYNNNYLNVKLPSFWGQRPADLLFLANPDVMWCQMTEAKASYNPK